MSDEREIREWRAGEPPRFDAFDADESFRPATETQWGWAFGANPGGARLFLAHAGDRVVARYAALAVRTRVLGETRTFANVLPALARPEWDVEILLATARAFHAAYAVPQGDLVLYGWPRERDERMAKQHLEHELLRVECVLARAPSAGVSASPEGVTEFARFGADADVLYACCATHWNASAIRDAAFLNWRFAENAFRRYRCFGVRSGGVLRGYAVFRAADELGPGLGLLVDWLVLPGDDEAAELLLASVLAAARAARATMLVTSFPEWSPWSLHFQERGFLHRPTEHRALVHSGVARFDMLWLRDNWWTTLADSLLL